MKYADLSEVEKFNLQIVCAKSLLTSFEIYLKSGKFNQLKKSEKKELWAVYENAHSHEQQICRTRSLFPLFTGLESTPETREEKHYRIRVAIAMEQAKRKYMLSVLGIEATVNRQKDWAEIGKRLADQHHFLEPVTKNPGRPKASEDIDLVRANAFDSMRAFVRVAQGKEDLPSHVELEYPPTEWIPSNLRLSDKLLLKVYHAFRDVNFNDEVNYCLSIVEDTLQLLGAKNNASIINSISRGRTQRRNQQSFSLVKNHDQIFSKS